MPTFPGIASTMERENALDTIEQWLVDKGCMAAGVFFAVMGDKPAVARPSRT